MTSLVKHIGSAEEFQNIVKSTEQPIVVDFQADWCGPCKMIAPVLDALSVEYANRVVFLSVNVDTQQDISQHFQIQAMPTFVFLKAGNEIGRMQGAQPEALKTKIRGLCSGGGGESLASASTASGEDVDSTIPAGFVDLKEFIVKNKTSCLNEKVPNSVQAVFGALPSSGVISSSGSTGGASSNSSSEVKTTASARLESDCDEQLLISIGFGQPVKIHSIRVSVPKSMISAAPKSLKLYTNRVALGFDETSSVPSTQDVLFKASDYTTHPQRKGYERANLNTRFVKFQKVTELFIFVESNLDDVDSTVLSHLQIIGVPLQAANMDNLKKMEDGH